jgi:cytochrome c oxidase subunit 2
LAECWSYIVLKFFTGMGAGLGAVIGLLIGAPAWADGVPKPWGLGMQTPGSPIQAYIDSFHDILLWIISIISAFVLFLLIFVIVRYNKYANPHPTTTAHNTKLEIVWTLLPCLILIGIAFVSFPLLYYTDRLPAAADLTLKVTGHQWYWSYEYPDDNGINFDSHAIWDSSAVTEDQAAKLIADASPGWLIKTDKPLRLLEVDNRVVLPVGKVVRVQIVGSDVEHSWFLPALGVNRMVVPGRLNELWLKVDHEGIYYGQCSMICGNGHGYMPIVVEAVTPEAFSAWVESKKTALWQQRGIYIDAPQYAALAN